MTQTLRISLIIASLLVSLSAHAADGALVPAASSGATADGLATVHQVFADRPAMTKFINRHGRWIHLKDGDILMRAAARLFNDGTHPPVLWNSEVPSKQCEIADHSIAHPETPAVIHLSLTERCSTKSMEGTEPIGFEHLWSGLFFEFFNIQNDEAFAQLFNAAKAGQLSECEFVEANTKLEYLAERKLHEFYQKVFLVWAKKNGFLPDPNLWGAHLPPTYKQWIAGYTNPNDYPWDYWSTYYKTNVVEYLQWAHLDIPARSCPDLPKLRADGEPNSEFTPN